MARYNEILVGRFNRALQKAFAMKGEPPAPQLASEITPAISMFWGVEQRYLEGWERFGNGVVQGAVAAQTFGFRFRNPAGSGVITVLELLAASNQSGGDTLQLVNSIVPQTDLATLDSPAQLDSRSRPNPSLICSHGTAASVALATPRAISLRQTSVALGMADFILFDDQEITILPGMTYQLQDTSGNVNQAAVCTYTFRERFLEDSERS